MPWIFNIVAMELIVMLHFIWLLVVGDLLELEGPEGSVQRRCSSEFNLKCQTEDSRKFKVTSELSACFCQAHQIRHLHSGQCERISVQFYQVAYG